MKLTRLTRLTCLAVSCVVGAGFVAAECDAADLTAAEEAAGWTILFDGTSTDAWRGYRQEAFPAQGWIIEDGCLKVTAGGGGGDIVTTGQYADFELVLEFRVSDMANSGIMYRATEEHGAPWMTGPEFQILDDVGSALPASHPQSVGAMYDLYAPSVGKTVRPAGEFNTARIVMKDGRLQHWLNGALVVECDVTSDDFRERIAASKFNAYEGFGLQPRGHVALQDHGHDVWFRDIRIRDLSAPMPGERRLFDGRSLRGWSFQPEGRVEDAWRVEDGVLICAGNPIGYIRTNDEYENFVLRLQWRFNPETRMAGNSGVLLRMTGPDKVWPKSVEAQLQSGHAGDFWNIDKVPMKTDPERLRGRNTKKTRFAERPIGEWNDYEIIVDGPDITLLVNGVEVNRAWNVWEGPGKICLQSEGAEIHFRNIRLAPIE